MSGLWIIDPSLYRAEDQGVAEIAAGWKGPHRLFRPALAGDGPDAGSGYDFDAVVLMGSAASVYDEHAWIRPLSEWLAPIVRGDVRRPVLGICFGHQLIAHLAGARVDWLLPTRDKRVGVEETEFVGSTLLGPEPVRLRVVVSHRESVVEAPRGFRVTARRPGVPVDGLEHERLPVYAYQFHPEAREEFAEASGIDVAAIDRGVREDSARLLDAFRSVASRSAGVSP